MSNVVRFDKIRGMAFNFPIDVTYNPIGFLATPTVPAPFTHAMRVLHFINDTDSDLMISFDGTNDNIVLIADSFALYDLTSDQDAVEHFRYEVASQLFVKRLTAISRGTLYVVAVYGKGE